MIQVPQLQPQDLGALAAQSPPPVLLDVREPWELARARIEPPGVELMHVPMRAVPPRLPEIPRGRPVVCLCHHGVRSAQVVAWLRQQGWTQAVSMEGGIDAWAREVDASVGTY